MGAVAWLLIPFLAAVFACVWCSWAARRSHVNDGPELAGYARFREAMEKKSSSGVF